MVKFLVVASEKDVAGMNVVGCLSDFKSAGFDVCCVGGEIVYTKSLNLALVDEYDYVIFASKHRSEKGEKTLSVHSVGNFGNADYGGVSRKVCMGSAYFHKMAFRLLAGNKESAGLDDYAVTLEATHHGPLIEKPCFFIEIGSTEKEWSDKDAGQVVAKTIADLVSEFSVKSDDRVAVAVGGPHYCPNFNKVLLNSDIAFCHIIPKYVLPLTAEMIQECIEKTFEEVNFVLLDWKGIGNSADRERIFEILADCRVEWRKASDFLKK